MQSVDTRWLSLRADAVFRTRLAQVYRDLRRRQGSQVEFGKAHNLHPKAVERLEQRKLDQVSAPLFRQLANAVHRTPEELIRLALPSSIVGLPGTADDDAGLARLRRQEADILNVPLLPGERVSFRFIWPDLVFAAPVRFQRQPRNGTTDTLEFSDPTIAYTAIIGPPGSGKSTALRLTALKMTADYVANDSAVFPLLVHARDIARHVDWTTEAMMDEAGLDKARPVARLIDGLDEVGETDRIRILGALRHSFRPGDLTVVTCRHDVFADLERKEPQHVIFDEIIEICEWNFDRNVVPFATGYLQKVERPHLVKVLLDACDVSANLRRFICNPFHLTLTLYLLQSGQTLKDEIFLDRYSLYESFYKQWIGRERRRGTSVSQGSEIVAAHVAIARALYKQRTGTGPPGVSEFLSYHPTIAADSAFEGLLHWRYDELTDHTEVVAFRHETLLEFILAFGLLDSMTTGAGLERALLTQYNNDVNSFVREGFSRLTPPRRKVVEKRLSTLLEEHATQDYEPRDATRIREQAIYYLGRLEAGQCPEILIRLSCSAPDDLLRRAAALGAILHGEEGVESAFIDELLNSERADQLNRSVQLAYFGDVDEDIFEFLDLGKCGWMGAREAIFARLAGTTNRDRRLRLWDLVTLLSFLKTRPSDTLSITEQEVVRAASNIEPESKERTQRLQDVAAQILAINRQRISDP